jgi:hypothetical protein
MLVTTSDIDSSGDATVTAQSVEGEDDLVDVSMQDNIEGDAVSRQEAERYALLSQSKPSPEALIRTKIKWNPQEIQLAAPRLDQP